MNTAVEPDAPRRRRRGCLIALVVLVLPVVAAIVFHDGRGISSENFGVEVVPTADERAHAARLRNIDYTVSRVRLAHELPTERVRDVLSELDLIWAQSSSEPPEELIARAVRFVNELRSVEEDDERAYREPTPIHMFARGGLLRWEAPAPDGSSTGTWLHGEGISASYSARTTGAVVNAFEIEPDARPLFAVGQPADIASDTVVGEVVLHPDAELVRVADWVVERASDRPGLPLRAEGSLPDKDHRLVVRRAFEDPTSPLPSRTLLIELTEVLGQTRISIDAWIVSDVAEPSASAPGDIRLAVRPVDRIILHRREGRGFLARGDEPARWPASWHAVFCSTGPIDTPVARMRDGDLSSVRAALGAAGTPTGTPTVVTLCLGIALLVVAVAMWRRTRSWRLLAGLGLIVLGCGLALAAWRGGSPRDVWLLERRPTFGTSSVVAAEPGGPVLPGQWSALWPKYQLHWTPAGRPSMDFVRWVRRRLRPRVSYEPTGESRETEHGTWTRHRR